MIQARSARGASFFVLSVFFISAFSIEVLGAQTCSTVVIDSLKSNSVTIITYDSLDNPNALGCGFFIGGQGDVITSRHVIKEAHRVDVKTSDGRLWPVKGVVAEDRQADLIRLSSEVPPQETHPLPIAETAPSLGDYAVVTGPQVEGSKSSKQLLEGKVIAVREIKGFGTLLEISTPVSPGFSGSPVANSEGEVIGITTFQLTGKDTVNFAVPVKRLLDLNGEAEVSIAQWEHERESREPRSNDELYLKGVNLICSGDWTAALECFYSIVNESPMHVLAYPMIGYCNLKLERWDEAAEAYYQALLIDPQDAASYYDMALAYGKLNRWMEAKASYKQAIRLDSTNTEAYCGLGMAYVNLDEWEEARRSFEKAISLDPSSPRPHYGLGLTCMVLDDMNAAWHEYYVLEKLDKSMAEDLYSRLSE